MESLRVKIFGEEYALLVDNKALTQSAAKRVQELMRSFKNEAPELSSHKYSVLAAIHLAEQNVELENRLASLLSEIERLSNLIESTTEIHN
ncbi:conserved hypothetical protein [Chloroherpeton thalassium ATCC 35110]|uniref:Cell division protein ZapA n=1 Tax=Chloroherpeton thalassium (strain ATCC 35110 / GB-78) TaxID=517418 RepID=B3QS32_CHLT3|nr:cell division protein ZapA [Chloroherpeton thalassium]ACF13977.1 conserved hypothetical protein [Chloroherpeton thalassium ATCC 35110]